jgi:diacylglycerol kinase (ATP)
MRAIDGAISMKFHSARNTMPFFFFSSIINKFWYACVSLGTIFSGKQFDLNKFLEIKCDGKKVDIPSNLQGVVFLNINSYAGGSKLWMPKDLSTWRSLDMSDGLVEVVGVLGVGHLGQIKAGVSSGIELAQGRRIQIRTKEFIPMQIDGEPWLQRPCKIDFRLLTR